MKISFNEQHLSIEDFNQIELPNLTVLTGTNGSGKSHLLQAIENKRVLIDGAANARIVYFNYETFKLENEGVSTAHQLASERESAWTFFNQHIKPSIASWKNSHLSEDYSGLTSICYSQDKYLWFISREDVNNDALYERLQSYKKDISSFFATNSNLKDHQQAQAILVLLKSIPFSVDDIAKDVFIEQYRPFHFKSDFLPMQLGKIIWDYYVKLYHNQILEFENHKRNKGFTALSDEDFIKKNGEKPWEIINKILGKFSNLEYSINSPEGIGIFTSYQLKLIHTKKPSLEIGFDSLSSGERVLMALVASIYKSLSDNHFPDVLLLDEIDASLHPSMINSLLEVIQEIFLQKGVKVILVTHSPTTVALAPEESIYVMNRQGLDRIEKKTKEEALEILTEGFMTLVQGIKVFDQVSACPVSVITEGHNTLLIKKALQLYGVTNVDVISGVEDCSGKGQMKVLFDFFAKVPHMKKVVFVWDCDSTGYANLSETNNTIPFIFTQDASNTTCKKGVENLFPETLFNGFTRTITSSTGIASIEFEQNRKREFGNFILGRNNKDDFINFEPLLEKLRSLASA